MNPALTNISGTGKWVESEAFSFDNVQSLRYWSDTTYVGNTALAWSVNMSDGYLGNSSKTANSFYVWPVRGGQ